MQRNKDRLIWQFRRSLTLSIITVGVFFFTLALAAAPPLAAVPNVCAQGHVCPNISGSWIVSDFSLAYGNQATFLGISGGSIGVTQLTCNGTQLKTHSMCVTMPNVTPSTCTVTPLIMPTSPVQVNIVCKTAADAQQVKYVTSATASTCAQPSPTTWNCRIG